MQGLFTATLLERLVTHYPALVANVDLIGGTSTGGIIALGLAHGKSPTALSALYRDNGEKIFDDSFWVDLVDLGKAVGADYGHKGLKRVLRKEFADTTLDDLGKRVLISSFDLDAPATTTRPRMWKPKSFHNFPGGDSDGEELVVDVAIRTSSAPTYFLSYQGYVDGDVVEPAILSPILTVTGSPSLWHCTRVSKRQGSRCCRDLANLEGGPDWWLGIERVLCHGERKYLVLVLIPNVLASKVDAGGLRAACGRR